jgi:hypothetical protein
MVGENEQRATIGAAENDIDRTFGHIDLADLLARRVVDEDLSIGNVHIALAIDGDALTAALRKGLQDRQRAVGGDSRAL